MLTLTPVVIEAIQAGIQFAPEIISAVQSEISLANAGVAPTATQHGTIDAALAAAHAALQAA